MENNDVDVTYKELGNKLLPLLHSQKLTIVGVGNVLQGDDGIGVYITHEIGEISKNVTAIVAATTPENVLSPTIQSNPDLVLIIDAADFGRQIGSIAVFDPSTVEDEAYLGGSHALPLSMFSSALKNELPEVKILIIGIQTGSGLLSSKISDEVRIAANWLISFIQEIDHFLTSI